MVDFKKHLRGKKKEEEDENGAITGTLKSWVLPVGDDPKTAIQRECSWRIGDYGTILDDDPVWITFRLTSGGVTGFESFVLFDKNGWNLDTLGRMANPKGYYPACAGTKNSWHEQRISHKEMQPVLRQLLEARDLIIVVCSKCWKGLEAKATEGGGAGWSHTICDDCSEE